MDESRERERESEKLRKLNTFVDRKENKLEEESLTTDGVIKEFWHLNQKP